MGKELADDLYQELFLILCEKKEEWIQEKYNSGYWKGFIIRIIFIQYYGKGTQFTKYFKDPIGRESLENIEIQNEEYEIQNDLMQLCVDKIVKELDWYHNKIWVLYRDGDISNNITQMNVRSINRSTGISRHEIWRVIKMVKEKAIQLYEQKYGKHFI